LGIKCNFAEITNSIFVGITVSGIHVDFYNSLLCKLPCIFASLRHIRQGAHASWQALPACQWPVGPVVLLLIYLSVFGVCVGFCVVIMVALLVGLNNFNGQLIDNRNLL